MTKTLGALALAAIVACGERTTSPPEPAAVAPAATPVAAPPVATPPPPKPAEPEERPWFDGEVQPGDSLTEILAREEVASDEASAVIRVIGDRMDMRALQAGQTYRLRFDDDKRVLEFELRLSRKSTVRVKRAPDGALAAERIDAVTRVEEVTLGGTITSSLYQAIKDAGEDSALVAFFVDVFAYDLNFYVDTHEGDTFRMIVEKEYLGTELLRYGRVLAAEYSGKAGTFRAYWWQPPGEAEGRYFDDKGQSIERTFLKTPLKYARVSSGFNPRRMHPILHVRRGHFGVDYAAPIGTPIWAAAAGKIIYRGPRGGAGNCVILAHDNGYQTTYMHMSKFRSGQAVGRRVSPKEVIGYVGKTGLATGPHLHFTVKIDGHFVDPLKLKMTRGVGVKKEQRAAFESHIAGEVTRLAGATVRPAPMASSGSAVQAAP